MQKKIVKTELIIFFWRGGLRLQRWDMWRTGVGGGGQNARRCKTFETLPRCEIERGRKLELGNLEIFPR